MSSKLDIVNMALSHLGVSSEVADFDLEASKEAQAARRFYDQTRDEVLRDFPWPFATSIETLAVVDTDPNTEWGYSYALPADTLSVRRILTGTSRQETTSSRVAHRIMRNASGDQLIMTDLEDATVEITYRETNEEKFAPDFVAAFSYLLAVRMAPRVAGGDVFKLRAECMQLYVFEMAKAKANAANELQKDSEPPESELITSRA